MTRIDPVAALTSALHELLQRRPHRSGQQKPRTPAPTPALGCPLTPGDRSA